MTDKTKQADTYHEMDAVIDAGKILMESGAEIYRIEETMKHMASTLEIEDFEAYVVNRGIIATGTGHKGVKEAKVSNVGETSIHLGRIEAVNALSREIEHNATFSLQEISSRLQDIREAPAAPFWAVLLAYFIGAGCFSYAIGSSVTDSLASAVSGLIMGLVLHRIEKYIHTKVLLTIIASSVLTISANIFYYFGLTEHRGLIILGALMLLVPGAAFTNSVREFAQNNYSTGLTLLMSALLSCISIAVGVALTTELLPFAEQMTGAFPNTIVSIWDVLIRAAMAGIGTAAFSYLFYAPRRYFIDLGFLGAVSWMLYLLLDLQFHALVPAIFIPAMFVAICSRFLSVKRKCPVTVFLSTSMFPLIPGLSFYRGVYFLLTGNDALASAYMRSCFISAFAIAVAIIIVQQIPRGALFRTKKDMPS